MNVIERLRALGREIAELQTEIRILDEQIVFQADVAEDARIRAVVSETPLADRDAMEARRDLERIQRSRSDAAARLQTLRDEQDRLLEQLLDQQGEHPHA